MTRQRSWSVPLNVNPDSVLLRDPGLSTKIHTLVGALGNPLTTPRAFS
jgi:hypothetical protein